MVSAESFSCEVGTRIIQTDCQETEVEPPAPTLNVGVACCGTAECKVETSGKARDCFS